MFFGIEAQQAFDRRTGELNGSLSGSARFTSQLTIMKYTRFSPQTGDIDRMMTAKVWMADEDRRIQ
jgi:hypothetical protein